MPGLGDGQEDEETRIEHAVAAVLGEVTKDHLQFFHGTLASAAASILKEGFREECFSRTTGDFGPGFYSTVAKISRLVWTMQIEPNAVLTPEGSFLHLTSLFLWHTENEVL